MLEALGPFFAVSTHSPEDPPRSPWRPMGELPVALADQVAATRDGLADANGVASAEVETRVAASVAQLGLVARLVSPVVAVAVLHGELLDLAQARWQLGKSPLTLSVPASRPRPARLAEEFARHLVNGPVAALVASAGRFSLAERIRWGNVASAVNGAAVVLAATRPQAPVAGFVDAVLDLPPLRGTHTTTPDGRFQRRSCCLIYRVAAGRAGPLCGDCVRKR